MSNMTQQQALQAYATQMADSSLFMGHRMSEWVFKAPTLDTEIALMNCALDLIGQSRSFYSYAMEVEGKGRSEDDVAYKRIQTEYTNHLIVELPNRDWGFSMVKCFYFALFNKLYFEELVKSQDEQLCAIAVRALKEVTYHVRYAKEWMIRLGDGTQLSHNKVQKSADLIWDYVGELFVMSQAEEILLETGISVDLEALRPKWDAAVRQVFAEATITMPTATWSHSGGKTGKMHTEHFEYILAEHQYIQNRYPNCNW
jgi:ring-1,2-phenylacetyl-CoA epoxidase subunit PaaC